MVVYGEVGGCAMTKEERYNSAHSSKWLSLIPWKLYRLLEMSVDFDARHIHAESGALREGKPSPLMRGVAQVISYYDENHPWWQKLPDEVRYGFVVLSFKVHDSFDPLSFGLETIASEWLSEVRNWLRIGNYEMAAALVLESEWHRFFVHTGKRGWPWRIARCFVGAENANEMTDRVVQVYSEMTIRKLDLCQE